MKNLSKVTLVGAAALCTACFAGGVLAAQAQNNSGEVAPAVAGVPVIIAPYAQAEAYVAVGVLKAAKGFTGMAHPTVGVFCFELPAGISTTTQPVVTVEWGSSLGTALFAEYNRANTGCVAPTVRTVSVRTYKGDVGGVGSALQAPVLSDLVAFNILVP